MKNTVESLFLLLASVSLAGAMQLSHPAPQTLWQPFHFDGSGFRTGEGAGGAATLRVKDGYLPLVNGHDMREEKLPAGTGAIAGVCFIQTGGGKLGDADGILPMEGITVAAADGKKQVSAITDRKGIFVISLPRGDYEVHISTGMSRHVSVEEGKTTLIAIRGGKRMVD